VKAITAANAETVRFVLNFILLSFSSYFVGLCNSNDFHRSIKLSLLPKALSEFVTDLVMSGRHFEFARGSSANARRRFSLLMYNVRHLLSFGITKIQKPGRLSSLKGNPAIRSGPVAFRPRLATGLAKDKQGCKKTKARYEDSSVAGFPVPPKRSAK